MNLTRRVFLKLATGLPFLRLVGVAAQPEAQAAQPPAQAWGFPLAFPAYFVKKSHRELASEQVAHKVFLPLVSR